ncbi:MAG: thiamine pyrophosphate-binding protein [Firmicutes bacterium]|nr:thiamine pyrophosphate-binding protein [Bacillota bacterium]
MFFGSDLVVELLRRYGIPYAAFNPGASFRGIHDSIVNYAGNRNPELIECCHEEISVAIAHGYAKVTGRPMAAITHNIVGLQHAAMAVFNAWCDRVPMLLLGGTGPMDATRRRPWIDWVHTALVQGNQVRDYVKWDDQPASLEAIPESFARAFQLASADPQGPVYLCYDVAIQEQPLPPNADGHPASLDPEGLGPARYPTPTAPSADPGTLEEIASLLTGALHPLIIADRVGPSAEGIAALVRLAEILAAPVIDRGTRFSFPNTHPLDATGAETAALAEADVILALGVDDLYGALLGRKPAPGDAAPSRAAAPGAKIVHVTLGHLAVRSWATDFQRLPEADLVVTAQPAAFAVRLAGMVEELVQRGEGKGGGGDRGGFHTGGNGKGPRGLRRQTLAAAHAARRAGWHATLADHGPQPGEINEEILAAAVWQAVRGEDWVLANGNLSGWARRLWDWERPGSYLGLNVGAGLGYGMGVSLGAALALRGSGRLVINLQSDGDFLFTPQALWTAAHHRIPVLIVMHNNRAYFNSVRHAAAVAGDRGRPKANRGVGNFLDDPEVDFAGLARSFGVHGEGPVQEASALASALARCLETVRAGYPALLDVRTHRP